MARFNRFQLFSFLVFNPFQSVAIGYKRAHPTSVVSVLGQGPRPCLRVKDSDSSQGFKMYGFVDAIKEFDPVGALGLLDPDFKVLPFFVIHYEP